MMHAPVRGETSTMQASWPRLLVQDGVEDVHLLGPTRARDSLGGVLVVVLWRRNGGFPWWRGIFFQEVNIFAKHPHPLLYLLKSVR